jgi:hypothetical protein
VNLFYPRGWDMLVAMTPDPRRRRLMGEISYNKAKRQRWARTFSRSVFACSPTLQLIWLTEDRRLARQIAHARLQLQPRKVEETLGYSVSGPKSSFTSGAEMTDQLVATWKRCSLQLDRACRANGVRYFHFLQPNQYVPDSKPMGEAEKKIAFDSTHPYAVCAQSGYPLLRAAGADLARQGVAFTDLTQIFAQVEEPIYIDTACHFGLPGNEIMAREVARTLVQSFRQAE